MTNLLIIDALIILPVQLIEVNLAEEGKEAQAIFISASLSVDLRRALIDLLKDYKDVFAWIYLEMPRLDPQLIIHQHNISSPLNQASRNI